MSWYNPLSWFTPEWAEPVAIASKSAYKLLMQAKADCEAGLITDAEYRDLHETYVSVYGQLPASEREAYQQGIAIIEDIIDNRTTEAVRNLPESLGGGVNAFWQGIPAWLKWAGIGGAVLFAIHTLARAATLARK